MSPVLSIGAVTDRIESALTPSTAVEAVVESKVVLGRRDGETHGVVLAHEEACNVGDPAFADAYESGTLIEFPPGEYLVNGEHSGGDVSRFGLRGLGASRRDVRIKPVAGSKIKWLKAVGAGPHLIENLSFHERSDDTTQFSLWLQTTDGSVVKNVEWLGRTPDDSGNNFSLTAEVTERDGVFVVDGIFAGIDEPSLPVAERLDRNRRKKRDARGEGFARKIHRFGVVEQVRQARKQRAKLAGGHRLHFGERKDVDGFTLRPSRGARQRVLRSMGVEGGHGDGGAFGLGVRRDKAGIQPDPA